MPPPHLPDRTMHDGERVVANLEIVSFCSCVCAVRLAGGIRPQKREPFLPISRLECRAFPLLLVPTSQPRIQILIRFIGNQYFEGVPHCLEISHIQRIDLPKATRFHADPTLFKRIQYLFKNMFDLMGFT